MPLYEYKCQSCGETFEVRQKFSDAPLTVHEVCGGAVKRLISAPSFQFKGSGWYVTDYGRSKGNNGSSKPAGEPAKNGGTEAATKDGGSAEKSTPAVKKD